jgi:hypothetical protein
MGEPLTWPEVMEAARKHGYDGPDPPRTEEDEATLAGAVLKAAKRPPIEREGIPTSAQETIEFVLQGEIEIDTG